MTFARSVERNAEDLAAVGFLDAICFSLGMESIRVRVEYSRRFDARRMCGCCFYDGSSRMATKQRFSLSLQQREVRRVLRDSGWAELGLQPRCNFDELQKIRLREGKPGLELEQFAS